MNCIVFSLNYNIVSTFCHFQDLVHKVSWKLEDLDRKANDLFENLVETFFQIQKH